MSPGSCREGKKSSIRVSSGQNLVSRPVRNDLPSWDVLSSSGTHWGSLTADIYDFKTPETPELRSVDPGIAMHLSAPTLIDLRLDGYRDTRVRVEGDLSIFSAGSCRQVQSKGPHRGSRHSTASRSSLTRHLRDESRRCVRVRCSSLSERCADRTYLSRDPSRDGLRLCVGIAVWRFSFARVVLAAAQPCVLVDLDSRHRGGIAPHTLIA